MNWCEGFKAMGTKVIVLPKHDLNYKLKLVSNEDCEKKNLNFSLAWEKTHAYLLFFLGTFVVRFS